MQRLLLLCCLLAVSGCFPRGQASTALRPDPAPVATPSPLPPPALPGQKGPVDALLEQGPLALTTRRTEARFPDGNRLWKVELHQNGNLLASWDAASGIAQRQSADRLWSPGNAAPLPAGSYRLGAPEPWGDDLWFDLLPRFQTTRSALGIHRCYPGTGCICIPSRADIDALAGWVKRADLRRLTVIN
jgi:hypothetical protein